MTAIPTITMNPFIDVFASTEKVGPVGKLRYANVQRDLGSGDINVVRVVKRCRVLYIRPPPISFHGA